MQDVNMILDKYISSRWTRDVKKRFCSFVESHQLNETCALRTSELSLLKYNIFYKASLTNDGTKFVKDKLRDLFWGLGKNMMAIDKVEDVGKDCLR